MECLERRVLVDAFVTCKDDTEMSSDWAVDGVKDNRISLLILFGNVPFHGVSSL